MTDRLQKEEAGWGEKAKEKKGVLPSADQLATNFTPSPLIHIPKLKNIPVWVMTATQSPYDV